MLVRSIFILGILTPVLGFSFFCTQFRPLKIQINETAVPGSVIKSISEPDDDLSSVKLISGDVSYIGYSIKRSQVRLLRSANEKRGEKLVVKGDCTDYLEPYKYLLNVSITIEVEVLDINDSPKFINLPSTVNVFENVSVGSSIFRIDAQNSDDVYPEFKRNKFTLLSIGSTDKPQLPLDEWFSVDNAGSVQLHRQLDYEDGPREIKIIFKVEDYGSPPKRNVSTLFVRVDDVDDLDPKFIKDVVSFSIIGEKPITEKECAKTSPPLSAQDMDGKLKSPIAYRLNEDVNNWSKYFSIDEKTGEICQIETVKFVQSKRGDQTVQEGPNEFNLTAQAYQIDDPNKMCTATVIVTMKNVNQHRPTFKQTVYEVMMREYPEIKKGSPVVTVQAEDPDFGRNGEIEYRLTLNPNNGFSVDPKTGEIKVESPKIIDRELNSTMRLKIRAVETMSYELYVSIPEAEVIIYIVDVNDNFPYFKKSVYNFTVKDNHPVGKPIHKYENRLVANDIDQDENGEVHLTIVSVQNIIGTFSLSDYQRFRINDEGVIVLQSSLQSLRREKKLPNYLLIVQAQDQCLDEKHQRSNTTLVYIQILESNDHPPVFDKKYYKVAISEAAPIGTLITEIKVTDNDGDEDIYITYNITDGNDEEFFRITNEGFLFTRKPLDREYIDAHNVTVTASDGVHDVSTTITVLVKDTNDNTPVFERSIFDFKIPENITINEDIGYIGATDADDGPNGQLQYTLAGEHSNVFRISSDGILSVVYSSDIFDREKNEVLILHVRVEDLGQPPQKEETMVKIHLEDVNDKAPVFSRNKYHVKIPETDFLKEYRLNQPVTIDDIISVTDDDVNPENQGVEYSLYGDGHELFTIDNKTGKLYIKNSSWVDCEQRSSYNLTVTANDGAFTTSVPLIIEIEDRNDNSPRFINNMHFVISPDRPVGSLVGSLLASDDDSTEQNSHLVYLLLGGSLDKFAIDANTGEIRVIDDLTVDPYRHQYNLKVRVVDFGRPQRSDHSIAVITVPINEAPVIPRQFIFRINESFPVNYIIGQVSVDDPDNGQILYQLSGGDDTLPFYMEKNDGLIRLASKLDTEIRDIYSFPVDIINIGQPNLTFTSTVLVYVDDVNDEKPSFSNWFYTTEIQETLLSVNDEPLKLSPKLRVTDEDAKEGEHILFELRGNGAKDFVIHQRTGQITQNKDAIIDCEKQCEYFLQIVARDENGAGLEGSADLNINVIDVNDNPPIVQNDNITYEVQPSLQVGSVLGRVHASDGDFSDVNSVLTYTLVDGGDGKFFVHPTTGDITSSDSLLKEPIQQEYDMTILVIDSGQPPLSASVMVTVYVPINIPPEVIPTAQFNLPENHSVNEVIWTFGGDYDSAKNISYRLEEPTDEFILNTTTGDLILNDSIDAESHQLYNLVILTIDHGEPTYTLTTTVTINVDDVNDNPPQFSSQSYQSHISENNNPTALTTLTLVPPLDVQDPDITSEPDGIRYELRGDGSHMFRIIPATGEIYVADGEVLDCEEICDYQFQIFATDEKGQGLSSSAILNIKVKDENDHVPEFLRNFTFTAKPSVPVGREIGTVQAIDKDREPINNRLLFYLTGLGGYGKFQIEADTGTIYTTDSLLRAPVHEEYNIKVVAVDFGSPQLTTETTVLIKVPVHPTPEVAEEFNFSVEENFYLGAFVGIVQLNTTDQVYFTLQNPNDNFHIDMVSGIVTTTASLDAEKDDIYRLPVVISESRNGFYSLTTTVVVAVNDQDDNFPEFSSDVYTTTIKEGEYKTDMLLHFTPGFEVIDDDITFENRNYELKVPDEFADIIYITNNQSVFLKAFTVLDRENHPFLEIPVLLESENHRGVFSEALLRIVLDDINDNPPKFHPTNQILVRPDLEPGSFIGIAEAADDDTEEPNNQILYELQSGGADKIRINSTTGELFLEETFTAEPMKSEFHLVVVARDLGYPSLSASTLVTLEVPLNKPPNVPNAVDFQIKENSPLGTLLPSLNITDVDSVHNLKLIIVDKTVPFMLEEQRLRTTDVLNAEDKNLYKFQIVTEDGGIPSYTMTSAVSVNIIDVNDNVPVFTATKYTGKITEHGYLNRVHITPAISVVDSDSGSTKDEFRYSLSGGHDDQFEIDSKTGVITATSPTKLDCEVKCVYDMKLEVTDEKGDGFKSSVPLKISLEDINDEAPKFEFQYSVYLNISTLVGDEVVKVRAVDKDRQHPNNHIIYLMEDGHGKFSIDANTGQVWLSHSLMDGGVKDRYNLTVTAIDSGTPIQSGITKVTIDIIKNIKPLIDGIYKFKIKENQPAGIHVGQIEAIDNDSPSYQLSYHINDTKVPFKIDQDTGEIFTTAIIDREQDAEFRFKAVVIDAGVPSYTVTTTVIISIEDVNDEPPRFLEGDYHVHIPENEIVKKLILVPNVTDEDASEDHKTFTFYLDSEYNDFVIDTYSGEISLEYPRSFDCEKDRNYKFYVIVTDKGGLSSKQPVIVFIDDVNDEAPVVEDGFNFTVHPSSLPGDFVGQVIAKDLDCTEKNNRLMFSLKGGGMSKFGIDSSTGNLTVASSLMLQPYRDVYNLQIEVLDSGTPRLSTEVIVTVYVPMNKAPAIPEIEHLQVKENIAVPSIIGKISTNDSESQDKPLGSIEFFMTNYSVPFEIERRSGFISVLKDLDSETVDQYQFEVKVIKQGYPVLTSSCLIIVEILDSNDNYPEFNSHSGYIGHVDEDSIDKDPTNSIPLSPTLYVSDKDSTVSNRNIQLTLIGSLLFEMDKSETGIRIIQPGLLDAEKTPVYKLLLEATDQGGEGLTTTTNITIYVKDLNDHAPVFETPQNASLSYLTPVGTRVGIVSAKDLDQSAQNNKVTYMLREGHHGKFDINPDSGEIVVAGDLSYEPCLEVYSLSVLAIDNGVPRQSSNTSFHINVPINQPPKLDPIINITVSENESPDTNIAQINIVDPDLIINKEESIEFYMDDIDAPFELDKYSGMLRTNGPIDRERVEQMTFIVRVVNDGAPRYTASTLVTVSVNDTNDNPPVFSSPSGYLAQIPENLSNVHPGYMVPLNTEFKVTDDDKTEDNRNIQIKLVGKGADLFELDQESGMMRLRQPSALDCEITCRYEFKLTATDQNGEGLSTSTNLTVELIDENDHSPRFLDNYTYTVSQLTNKFGYIGKIVAVDDDATNQNNQITYLLKSGGFGKFFVDSETGEIIVIDALNRHPKYDNYKLIVVAQDNGVPKRMSVTTVNINVPVNHRPWMTISKHDVTLPEDIASGYRVAHIKAKDKDKHQTLTYHLKEQSTVPFHLNSQSGWLMVQGRLDREKREFYTLHITAEDNGTPRLTSSALVKIRVEDVNDNFPRFTGGNVYQGFVQENNKNDRTPQTVHLERNITVTDGDATPVNRKVKLYLHGLGSQLFKLNAKTGQLTTSKTANIDREVHDFFHFKVMAVDSGMPAKTSTGTILISVVDINDNHPKFFSPTFTFDIPEDIKPGGVIGRALAVDKDATQPNNLLLYLLENEMSGKFRLDINTGTIFVSEGFFAQPLKPSYKFNITARDLGFPAGLTTTEVTLNIPNNELTLRDIKKPRQNVMVLTEEIPIGSIIGRLEPELKYPVQKIEIDPDQKNEVPFKVKPNGAIITTDRIDREAGKPYYNFKVMTLYNCTPPMSTVRDITAIVDDVNDNAPIFPLKQYTSTISQRFPADTVVATPVAFDEVDERPSSYSYSLAGPQPELIKINKTTGVVRTTNIVKNVTSPQILSYTVTARDNQNPNLIARTKLNLHVMPKNFTDC